MERITVFDGEFWAHKNFPPVKDDTVDEFVDCVKELAARLAAYEDTGLEPEEIERILDSYGRGMTLRTENAQRLEIIKEIPINRIRELAQAEKEGRLVVLEHAAKKGEKKPPCFYNDMGLEFCLGLARGECDDEPIDRCKECWYCESTREAAEAALKEREAEHDR